MYSNHCTRGLSVLIVQPCNYLILSIVICCCFLSRSDMIFLSLSGHLPGCPLHLLLSAFHVTISEFLLYLCSRSSAGAATHYSKKYGQLCY